MMNVSGVLVLLHSSMMSRLIICVVKVLLIRYSYHIQSGILQKEFVLLLHSLNNYVTLQEHTAALPART